MILPENEFSHLKGVNNQPYLDIRTSASHLIKRFFIFLYFLYFTLFTQLCFLHSSNRPFPCCILSLCQTEPKYAKPLIFTRRLVLKQTKGYIHPWAAHRSFWLYDITGAVLQIVFSSGWFWSNETPFLHRSVFVL